MYKNIFLSLFIVAIIAGCSAPKPEVAPEWYTNVPSDSKLYYAVGASDSKDNSTKAAIESMAESLGAKVAGKFKDKEHPLQPLENETLEKISKHTLEISKKLSLQNIKLEKSTRFKGRELVLISIPRAELFEKIKPISDLQFLRLREAYTLRKTSITIKKFALLDELMEDFPRVAALVGYKKFLLHSYNAENEFKFLKEIKDEYDYLKSAINIYLLSDANSRIFAHNIRAAIKQKGLSTKNSLDDKNSVKLLITSETSEVQNYNFLQSKSLIKFTTFDNENKQLAFRQHTFVGQSAKDFQDAKEHASADMKRKIKKLSLFDFIGFEK
ncbi:hypothetical protein [Sulfurimonas sp.]|uniref:hypothetical protein n=1 Tax=Sulfurimonas sp. TaxID=2022749 RepID=UPI0025D3B7DD|nr:hypothetical protein [Sulfurimonas sp.]MBW6487741.1 LPP20 family lipoprotein [Sulfurimonas sp.]